MTNFWSKSILRVDSIYKININNSQQCIKMKKITLNMSSEFILDEPKTILYPLIGAKLITNQKPSVCKAKKSIALLKLRKGMLTGIRVTLRRNAAFNFLNLLILIILPNDKELKFCNLNNKGCLSIKPKNLFVFPQMSLFYDRFPKSMKCTINVDVNTSERKQCSLFYSGLLISSK